MVLSLAPGNPLPAWRAIFMIQPLDVYLKERKAGLPRARQRRLALLCR